MGYFRDEKLQLLKVQGHKSKMSYEPVFDIQSRLLSNYLC